jgi:transcriptional regulator with XRE-family HTH domain
MRHALTQGHMAAVMGVSQRTISRWERGEDRPSIAWQRHLRDLGWQPPGTLLRSLAASIPHCTFLRALSRTRNLRLQALSRPAIEKRPSVTEWIGRDLALVACGILEEMLDDSALQRSIANREIACVLTTTRSVLRTREHAEIGTYRTVITYLLPRGNDLQRCGLHAGSCRRRAGLQGRADGRVFPSVVRSAVSVPVPRGSDGEDDGHRSPL